MKVRLLMHVLTMQNVCIAAGCSAQLCFGLQPVLAARFCPKLFESNSDTAADRRQSMPAEGNPFDLSYRMVFAVATSETVMIYDTSGQGPLAVLGGLHFEAAPITDIAWSCDGRYLGISSYDGETHPLAGPCLLQAVIL